MLILFSFLGFFACSEKETPQKEASKTEEQAKESPKLSLKKPKIKKQSSKKPSQKTETTKKTKDLKNSDYRIEYKDDSIIAKDAKGGTLSTLYAPKEPSEGCESEEGAVVLSLVQGFASIEHSGGGYCEGAAHPYAFTNWATVYVVKPFKEGKTEGFYNYSKLSITKFFPEEEVLSVLLQDSVIKKHLVSETKPKTIKELSGMLDGGCSISFHDLEYNFAFHHIKDDKIAVRFGLPHGCEVERGNFTQLGVYLPIPEKWNTAFTAAEKNKTLMKDLGL